MCARARVLQDVAATCTRGKKCTFSRDYTSITVLAFPATDPIDPAKLFRRSLLPFTFEGISFARDRRGYCRIPLKDPGSKATFRPAPRGARELVGAPAPERADRIRSRDL